MFFSAFLHFIPLVCLDAVHAVCVYSRHCTQLLFQAVYPHWRREKGAAILEKEKMSNL